VNTDITVTWTVMLCTYKIRY